MSGPFRIGIDLGGTKIEGAAVDVSGSMRVRRRVATPVQNYRATIDAIIALVRGIEQEIGVTASVGIGIPGAVSPKTGLIKNANSTWLIGRPLQRDIETALGSLCHYISGADPAHYQPANITFDLLPQWDLALNGDARESLRRDKKARHALVCRRALDALEAYV